MKIFLSNYKIKLYAMVKPAIILAAMRNLYFLKHEPGCYFDKKQQKN